MIKLDYSLDPSWERKLAEIDLRSVGRDELHYDLFLGHVTFQIDGHDFSASWGWVPVLDFAVCLKTIVEGLAIGRSEAFEFTESDAKLQFERRDDSVHLSANYVPDLAEVAYDELLTEVRAFAARVIEELARLYPPLIANQAFQSLWNSGDP